MRPTTTIFLCCLFALSLVTGHAYSQQKQNSLTSGIKVNAAYKTAGRIAEPDYPVDACFTYTFRMKVGAPVGNTFIKQTLKSLDGTLYVIGSAKTAGITNSFLQQIDFEGNILWTKQYDTPLHNLIFNEIEQAADGQLVITGNYEVPGTADSRPFVCVTDEEGVIQWNRLIDLPGYSGKAIAIAKQTGIAFTADDDSTLVYGKLDWSGNLLWAKRIHIAEEGRSTGLIYDGYSSAYIGYTGTDSARSVGAIVEFNMQTGNLIYISRIGGVSMNADFILHDVQMRNSRAFFTGIYSVNSEPYHFFLGVIRALGGTEGLTIFDVPGKIFDVTAQSKLSSSGDAIIFKPSATLDEVYGFQLLSSLPNTKTIWQKQYSIPPGFQLSDIKQAFDGGFYLSGNFPISTADTQGLILKTDSIGTIKNCEGNPFDMEAKVLANVLTTRINTTAATISPAGIPFSIGNTATTLPATTECKSLSCPVRVVPDACFTSFIKRFRGSDFRESGNYILIDEADELNVLGNAGQTVLVNDYIYRGSIARFDNKGNLLNRKKFAIGNGSYFTRMIYLKDGNVMVLGNTTAASPLTGRDTSFVSVIKFTRDYDLIWTNSFPYYNSYSNIYDIVEDADGSIFLNFMTGTNILCKNTSIVKMDASGNFLWRKEYAVPNACGMGTDGSMTQDAQYLYFANWASGPQGMLLFKVEKATGNLAWVKTYQVPGADQIHICRDIAFIGPSLVLQGSVSLRNSTGYSAVMIMDKDGNIQKSRSLQTASSGGLGARMTVTKNNQIVLVGGNNSFVRLDSDLNILYSKQMRLPNVFTYNVKESADGSIYSTGSVNTGSEYFTDMSLQRFSPEGMIGSCFSDTLLVSTGDPTIIATAATASIINIPQTFYQLPYFEQPFSLQENSLLCATLADCSTVALDGPVSICDSMQYTINARRSPGCNTPVYFSYSGDKIRMTSKTDSSFTFKFLESGSSILKAKIFTGCVWVEDEITVQANIQQVSPLDLGADKELCPGNTIELKAQSDYLSYLWNDGSTNPTLFINTAGEYSVKALDGCGKEHQDTILVTLAAPVFVSLGNDQEKCNNDTLQLKAPDGFISYTWGPDYNLSSSGQTAIVFPSKDTAYHIRVEKSPGCYGFDTISIKVNRSLPINLGNDTSFCRGDVLTLNAGQGFSKYVWSNGASGQSVDVSATGNYSVIATSAEGCRSYDTLTVLNTWPLPVVTLEKNPNLCVGESRTFNAGTFDAYVWHNGSTQPTFTANTTGTYYVTVTDQHFCKGTDTTIIHAIVPGPSGFLPADTTICSYGSLVLKSNAIYASYLWSTNSSASSINITTPGIYWLQVKDNNGCVGRDSIVIDPRKCLEGFFAPSAFTPNNDGNNDVFKPYVLGNVSAYRLSVFNRWGQLVFQTLDPNRGWDGKFAGVQQDSNAFVWVCTFRFEGQTERTEKGTVMLIR